jgi:hypothetical protein
MGKSKGKVFLFLVVRYIATEASVPKIMVGRVLLILLIQVVLLFFWSISPCYFGQFYMLSEICLQGVG